MSTAEPEMSATDFDRWLGEMGSAFGYLYLSGGNLAECLVTGKIAGAGAAAMSDWD